MRLNVWRLEFGRPSQLQACPLLISLIWIHTFTQLPPQKFTKAIVRFVTWVTYFLFSTPGAWPLTSWWTLSISSIPGHFRAERAPRALSNRATVTRRGRKRIKWKYTGQIIHVSYKKSSHILNQKEVNIFISYASGILIPSPLTLLFLSLLCLSLGLFVALLCSPWLSPHFRNPLSRSVNSGGDAVWGHLPPSPLQDLLPGQGQEDPDHLW